MPIDVEDTYREYGPLVLRRCRRLLGDEIRARDAMQDTFVRLWQHRGRLHDGATASLLFRMATRVCLNTIRDEARRGRTAELSGDEALGEIAAANPEGAAITLDFLSKVFTSQAESTGVMAVMFYLDRMTLAEIATETGLSVSGVRKRLRGFGDKVTRLRSLE